MEDPKPEKGVRETHGAGGPQAVSVPAKGDSSASNPPVDPMGGATLSDAPLTPTPESPPPASKPTMPELPPDATISDSLAASVKSPADLRRIAQSYTKEAVLQPGDIIGGRYEILQLLGEGGMGAVYKAMDRAVERTVALKLIRPELASNPTILARFKQELLTARQVTHKNVVRIYDLTEAEGIQFITMEFVEGSDLRHLLITHEKLPPEKVVEIIRQVCLALDAAHSEGIIHRDLKPQNIMQDTKTGRILVMDFGLARSMESGGMTQTGALLGTIEYMSPEQSMGKTLDQRSDIFALGLIFYEMLTGKTPYKADSAMASLMMRNQQRATPAVELDETIPKALSDIVSKCLERDLEQRYQNVQQVLADLDNYQGARPTYASITLPAPVAAAKAPFPWKWVAVGALAVVAVGAGWVLKPGVVRTTSSTNAIPKAPEISLAILPFHNATGDTSLDWLGPSLAEMLRTDVGQSASLRTVSSDRLHQVLKDLRISNNADFDPDTLKRLAEFSNADTLVWGHYAKFGDQIRIDATLQDLKHNRSTPLKIEAASQKEIPATVDGLAELIRKNLSVSSDVVKELKASSFQPTSKSVEALRDYNQGLQLLRDGKNLEAVKMFQAAVQEDPDFALAYSHLAETNSALGYDEDADKYSRKAVELSQQLPLAERYLIEGNRARIMKDTKKGLEAYENLAKTSFDNADVEFALGSLYEDNRELDKARAHYNNVLKSDPKDIDALLAIGRVDSKRGDPQAALDPLGQALSIATQVQNLEQQAMVLQATGIAYKLLGRSDDALRNFQQSIDINTRLDKKRGVAANLKEIAIIQARMGKPDLALAGFNKAIALLRGIGAKKEVGDTLIDLGQMYEEMGKHDQALQQFKEALQIERDSGDELFQAYCLNDIGNLNFAKGEYQDALIYFQQALQLREKLNNPAEIAEVLSNIGETMAKTGQFDKAIDNHLRALDLERKAGDTRGAAFDSSSLGTLFGYQGRLGAAIDSTSGAVKSLHDLNDRSLWAAQAMNGYASALIQAGRSPEAQPILKDASALAKELKSDVTLAEIAITEGDDAYYRADYKSAQASYQRALEAAQRAKSREDILTAQFNLARVQLQEGDSRRALAAFRSLGEQADKIGLKYISLECSIYAAQALLSDKNYADAAHEAQRALARSEAQSLRMQMAREHYILGSAARATGNASEAASQFRNAVQIWNDVRNDTGAERTLGRADLKALYADASQAAPAKS